MKHSDGLMQKNKHARLSWSPK